MKAVRTVFKITNWKQPGRHWTQSKEILRIFQSQLVPTVAPMKGAVESKRESRKD